MAEAARRVAQIFDVSPGHALPTVSPQTLQRYHAYLQAHLSLPFDAHDRLGHIEVQTTTSNRGEESRVLPALDARTTGS